MITTTEDRRKELHVLIGQMRDHPSRNWDWARDRAVVLRRMLAGTGTPAG